VHLKGKISNRIEDISNMSENLHQVSDDSFEADVIQSDTPVLVDFWAEWCGPCRMIAPLLEQVAEEYGDKLKIVKMNVDDNTDTPAKYGVRGIPTLLLVKKGEVAATKVGALTKSQLTAFIDDSI
jgi:thioredoxin 1